MNVTVAFDVDGTLDISGGRIPVKHLLGLRRAGWIFIHVNDYQL